MRGVTFVFLVFIASVAGELVNNRRAFSQQDTVRATTHATQPACIPSEHTWSLIHAIDLAEDQFLFSVKGNTTTEHMWWNALVGLNQQSQDPYTHEELRNTVRYLRNEGYVDSQFEGFLLHDVVRESRNAYDFFRMLTLLCERNVLQFSQHPLYKSLRWALWSLKDPYTRYIPPPQMREPKQAFSRTQQNASQDHAMNDEQGARARDVTVETIERCTLLLAISTFFAQDMAERTRSKLDEHTGSCDTFNVVLDLRDNRGGTITEAIEMADLFLSEGIIAATQHSDPEGVTRYRASSEHLAVSKIAVVVNEHTFSAAEIVAAALVQNTTAVLVGERTGGKGVGQTPFSLPNGGTARITTERILTPNGGTVHHVGLTPSIGVPSPRTERILELLTEHDEKMLARFDNDIRIAFTAIHEDGSTDPAHLTENHTSK